MNSLSTGNGEVIKQLADNGRVVLEKTKDIEVPEKMLPLHIKGLQLAQYSVTLEGEVGLNTGDPLKDISDLMKIQSLLSASLGYASEVESEMAKYGINAIDVNL